MSLKSLLKMMLAGFLLGSLAYGLPLAISHVAYNSLTAIGDGAILLLLFGLVYGAWCAATFAVAEIVVSVVRTLRRLPPPAIEPEGWPSRSGLVLGAVAFNSVFWFFALNYGLTYDEYPFGRLDSALGMLLYLSARTVSIVVVATLVSWLVIRAAARLLGGRRLLPVFGALYGAAVLVTMLLCLYQGSVASAADSRSGHATVTSRDHSMRDASYPYRLILIGIDGADWRVIEPMMEAGRLESFARIVREGSCGPLATLPDANSAIIWASIYTGRSPEAHMIHDFYQIHVPGLSRGIYAVHRTYFKEVIGVMEDAHLARRYPVDRRMLGAIPLWEAIHGAGLEVGVVDGYYYSYPVVGISGSGSYVLAYGSDSLARKARRSGQRPAQSCQGSLANRYVTTTHSEIPAMG